MKVLVVGAGGREHALVAQLAQSAAAPELYCAPGNDGIGLQARLLPIAAEDVATLYDFARRESIDLTVVGPEAPLTLGIVDAFQSAGLRIVGPSRAAAALEGSKVFAKQVMRRCGVPTAEAHLCATPGEARQAAARMRAPLVVKADGLAAGKGAIICQDRRQAEEAIRRMMEEREFGAAGERLLVEEFLEGEEASFIALVDGETIAPLAPSQDHKPIGDGDRGPNTGGMGAYAPAPIVTRALAEAAMRQVMQPVVRGMAAAGSPFRGILYAGLMIKEGALRVLEFNVRFGDPEAQVILPLLDGDLLEVLMATAEGRLHTLPLKQRAASAVCVVMASGGYPGAYEKGRAISGLDEAGKVEGVTIYHAGTRRQGAAWLTNGGRVLGVTAVAPTFAEARRRAYAAAHCISWEGAQYRTDIGAKAERAG
ncbi:MAG: phosphoribosylamine--glycine ligase [Candidatus Tectomicrobia bacterium]|nr:phosphoribosylamine--glycine ligase [Candidatus Tectomicrobia bacterium]